MWSPPAKIAVKSIATIVAAAAVFTAGYVIGDRNGGWDDYPIMVPGMPFEQVLDGDTIVDHGRAIHIAGIDAPELGPWARCWAEAALAGFAKDHLESRLLEDRGWHIVDLRKTSDRHLTGSIIDRNGYEIADEMRVGGNVAITLGHWDWCKTDPEMHAILEGEKPPIGPQLWWPSGSKFDPRAAD